MSTLSIIRKTVPPGRITFPFELLQMLDINAGDLVEFFIEDKDILLRKFEYACVFCGETKDLQEFKKKYVCRKCRE